MKKIFFAFITTILFSTYALFAQGFLDSILVDDIERKYNNVHENSLPYTVSLHFDLSQYRIGNPITMKIVVKAVKNNVSFTNSISQFENYNFNLYDQNNNLIPISENYTLWAYRGLEYMDGNNFNVVSLNEGETFSRTIDLNDWFSLNKTGRYRIEGDFFPMSKISKNEIKTQISYFVLEERIQSDSPVERTVNNITNIPYTTPSTNPPYEVINNLLVALGNKNWEKYFANIHLPSIIMVSERYGTRFVETYGENVENFSDTGIETTIRDLNLGNFLKERFGSTLTLENMQKDFGGNFVRNMERTYNSETVRTLAIFYELNYRLSLSDGKKEIFNQYKKYLASPYDRNLRRAFIYDTDEKSLTDSNLKERKYYKSLAEMMKNEYSPDTVYTLNNFEIIRTTVEKEYGLDTATVETKLYQNFHNLKTRYTYSPITYRTFTLRKMGEYWYVVDYYDSIKSS